MLDLSPRELRALRWREIAIVFQSAMNALNPVLRVGDQLGDVIDAHLQLDREARRERLNSLLDMVGIPRERLRSYPHELSGGMRQRIMIAMALATEPEVVIMDEPTTALDVVVQREILAEVAHLQKELGFAVLFITHDLSLLLEIADRIAMLYGGRMVELGTGEQIHRRRHTPTRAGCSTRSPAFAARVASWRASPDLRPTHVTCRPAVRSSPVAGSRSRTAGALTCGFFRQSPGTPRT